MARGRKTGGRKKGTANKMTLSLKDTLMAVLEDLGGEDFIREWAESHKTEFMIIMSKLLPRQPLMEVQQSNMQFTIVTGVPESEVAPKESPCLPIPGSPTDPEYWREPVGGEARALIRREKNGL
jgi:hypothetical protein